MSHAAAVVPPTRPAAVPDLLRDQLQTSLGTPYTLGRELGGGGMSRVFVAHEEALGRDVVVKVLAPELAAGLSAERFTREIKVAAALQAPHIVPVHSAGVMADGLPYYTMPYVRGESLRARLAQGPVPLAEAVSILRDVAQGARVRTPAARRAPRHQAREHPAAGRHGGGHRLRHRQGVAAGARPRLPTGQPCRRKD